MGQSAKGRVANGGSKGGKGAQAQAGSYWNSKNKPKKEKTVKEEQKKAKASSLCYVLLGLLVALIAVGAGKLFPCLVVGLLFVCFKILRSITHLIGEIVLTHRANIL